MPEEELLDFCWPLAVDLQIVVQRPDGLYVCYGAGTVLHEDGYILACAHVMLPEGNATIKLHDGTEYPFRILGLAPSHDTAVVKIEAKEPLRAARIGRSNTVRAGDPVLIIGNPEGRAHTVSRGVVNNPSRGGPGRFQIDGADVNPGDSGGPVFNSRGEVIGMVQIKNTVMEGVSYSVRIDHIREAFGTILADEERHDYRLGLKVDTFGRAKVLAVTPGSAADRAGVRTGDVVRRFGEMHIDGGMQYVCALMSLASTQPFPLVVERRGELLGLTIKPSTRPLREPADVAEMASGVACTTYVGTWDMLPNFDQLTPVDTHVVPMFGLFTAGDRQDHFGLMFRGYVEVPLDGKYAFYLSSDDGSRLWIGEQVIVDNDGLHGEAEKSGVIFLKAGKHPIRVAFFQGTGGRALTVSYEGPGLEKQEIPMSALFTEKP